MELTLEALVAAGVAEDTAKQILSSHQAAQAAMVPKARLDEAAQALTTAKTDLAARDKQLAELKPLVDKGSELETRIAELEKQNKEQAAASRKELEDFRKRTAIQTALQGKAQDSDIVLSLIDTEKVTVDERGTVTGLSEQVARLEKEKAFLFKSGDEDSTAGATTSVFQPMGNVPPSGTAPRTGTGKPKPGDFGKKMAEQAAATAAKTKQSTDYYFGGNK